MVRTGPFSFAAVTFAFLPYLSPLIAPFLFFLLVGTFFLYLLILFVAKPAEGGASVCGLLLTLHLPPLPFPLPPRERSADLTTAVTAAAAATTAAALVMSTCPQVTQCPGPSGQGEAVQFAGVPSSGPWSPSKATGSVGLLGNASLLCRGLRDFTA